MFQVEVSMVHVDAGYGATFSSRGGGYQRIEIRIECENRRAAMDAMNALAAFLSVETTGTGLGGPLAVSATPSLQLIAMQPPPPLPIPLPPPPPPFVQDHTPLVALGSLALLLALTTCRCYCMYRNQWKIAMVGPAPSVRIQVARVVPPPQPLPAALPSTPAHAASGRGLQTPPPLPRSSVEATNTTEMMAWAQEAALLVETGPSQQPTPLNAAASEDELMDAETAAEAVREASEHDEDLGSDLELQDADTFVADTPREEWVVDADAFQGVE